MTSKLSRKLLTKHCPTYPPIYQYLTMIKLFLLLMHSAKTSTSEPLHHTSFTYLTNRNQNGTSITTMMPMTEEDNKTLTQPSDLKTNNIEVNKITNHINITTHNIRGMSQPLKIKTGSNTVQNPISTS